MAPRRCRTQRALASSKNAKGPAEGFMAVHGANVNFDGEKFLTSIVWGFDQVPLLLYAIRRLRAQRCSGKNSDTGTAGENREDQTR
jgi:hypothetical protein